MDCSLPGSSVHGILQGKNTGMGCHYPPPGNLPNPGIELTAFSVSSSLKADSLPLSHLGSPEEISSFSFYCFPLFLYIVYLGSVSYLSLLFFGTLH